jgi:Protein of unknown function (DUF2721)
MDLNSLAEGVKLSVAPVFLLTAVATLIGALAQRLARIIDRARVVEERLFNGETVRKDMYCNELLTLRKRGSIVNVSIALLTVCAMLVGMTIVEMFIGEISNVQIVKFVPVTFLGGLSCFILALACFLVEVTWATHALRFGIDHTVGKRGQEGQVAAP